MKQQCISISLVDFAEYLIKLYDLPADTERGSSIPQHRPICNMQEEARYRNTGREEGEKVQKLLF